MFTKFPLLAVFLVASVFVAGCNSLDNPVGGLLDTGRDARVYNPQTGEFEWPKDSQNQKPRGRRPATTGTAPAQERQGDGRYYDLQKNQWVEAREERAPSSKPKSGPATPAPTLLPAPPPKSTPPPERPARASGVYNPSTGEIEWRTFDPAPAPTPAPKKSWYWPF
jgi:hypothetical protein